MSDHKAAAAPPAPDHPPPPSHSQDYAPYPKLDLNDVAPPPHSETWTSVSIPSEPPKSEGPPVQPPVPPPVSPPVSDPVVQAEARGPIPGDAATSMPAESNPYVATPAPPPPSSVKKSMDSVKDALGKWGKKAAEATKKAEDLAGNMWQHLKTGPSFADAAVTRIAQSTKVLAEGGYEKIFRQNFETVPEEQLQKTFACYLSTSAGPVMGTLFLSSAKLAFCSDDPLSYKVGDRTEWSYYKVIIPLHQLKAVNPSTSKVKAAEKYIQVVSVDNHEFWFMSFVHYDSAVKHLQEVVQPHPQSQPQSA
ncbi:hypothetical protein ACFX12_019803 [Malus domestica]